MVAFVTNILFPFVVSDDPDHAAVGEFIRGLDGRDDVAFSEFALVELYGLLRQPTVRWCIGRCGSTRQNPGSRDVASTTPDAGCAWWLRGCASLRP